MLQNNHGAAKNAFDDVHADIRSPAALAQQSRRSPPTRT